LVVSHSNNFIFLRIPKNASSTLGKYFVDKCDKDTDKWTILHFSGIRENKIPKDLIRKYAFQYRHVHLTLQEILDEKVITQSEAESMKKIAVIRNPLHRQLSLYFFLVKNRGKTAASPEQFREWFKNGCHYSDVNNKPTQSDYVKLDNVIAPNVEFWKYEDIQKNVSVKLEYINSGFKPNKDIDKLVAEYYDNKTKQAVLEYYHEDMEIYKEL